jgi:hypothetical protein
MAQAVRLARSRAGRALTATLDARRRRATAAGAIPAFERTLAPPYDALYRRLAATFPRSADHRSACGC